jgi:hypothetical protein
MVLSAASDDAAINLRVALLGCLAPAIVALMIWQPCGM